MKQKRSTNKKQTPTRRHPIHKRVMLHPVWLFILLCLGVLLFTITPKTIAENYTVTAVVPAAPLTESAVITSPADGATITSAPLEVTGDCPANSYVSLLRNGYPSGVAICDNSLHFSITTDLAVGANNLVPQAYNITDMAGPTGTAVTVYYQPPPVNVGGGGSAGTTSEVRTEANTPARTVNYPSFSAGGAEPLLLTTLYTYQTFKAGQEFSWSFDLSGGKAPYAVNANWGNGSTSNYTFSLGQKINLTHRYSKPGNYTVKVTTVDANRNQVVFQISAVIKPYGKGIAGLGSLTPATPSGTNAGSNFISQMPSWLLVSWPAYGIVLLMTISFWLGERQELFHHFSRKRTPKRRQYAR